MQLGSSLLFANAWGWWALLGVAAVFGIHFLQRRSKQIEIATLFLLKQTESTIIQGRTLERLRNSIPLWLQVLAAALLTFLLLEPRWLRHDSVRRVAVVLDSSLSMEAFKNEIAELVPQAMQQLARVSGPIEWQILVSDSSQPPLYSGPVLSEAIKAVTEFRPQLLGHSLLPSLTHTRNLLGPAGRILLVTDRKVEVPPDINLLSVGSAFPNVGWAGAQVFEQEGELIWKAAIKNYSDSSVERSWHLSIDGAPTPAQQISLEPDQVRLLQGILPKQGQKLGLVLSADRFQLDDVAPLVRPAEKLLRVRIAVDAPAQDYLRTFFATQQPVEAVGTLHLSHLVVRGLTGSEDPLPAESAIYFALDQNIPDRASKSFPIQDRHALMNYLNWNSLLVRSSFPLRPLPSDEVLLWLDSKPLVFLRTEVAAGKQQSRTANDVVQKMFFNFDPRVSNAAKVPALTLLLHRFVSEVRNRHVGYRRQNLEANQLLELSLPGQVANAELIFEEVGSGRIQTQALDERSARFLRAPARASFLRVLHDGTEVELSAVTMPDAGESDFRAAARFDRLDSTLPMLLRENSEADFLAPLWLVLLIVLMLANWHYGSPLRQQAVAQ